MTITISISSDTEARLRQRAAASGQPVEEYTSQVLERVMTSSAADELLAPFRKQVADSGMSDRELDEFFEEVREEAWQEKQRNKQCVRHIPGGERPLVR